MNGIPGSNGSNGFDGNEIPGSEGSTGPGGNGKPGSDGSNSTDGNGIPKSDGSTDSDGNGIPAGSKDSTGSGGNGIPGSDRSDGPDGSTVSINRIGPAAGCSKSSITILQGQTAPMPNGIPTYTAQVHNICVSGNCNIGNIHLSCGWFSTARTINPSVFRRLAYDDCLVNDGKPLRPGQTIIFSYANTFSYPMAVKSVTCF